ncbi:MAG: hypothetical protein QXL16_01935 [Candidatus Micrarchaeaceae archaeon]
MDVAGTAAYLMGILKQEKSTGELLSLDSDFYSSFDLKGATEEERKNIEYLLQLIKEKRLQKILVYIAYNKPLPGTVPKEEESLYNRIVEIIKENRGSEKRIKRIKVIKDVPEIVVPSGEKIGPFSKGQIIELEEKLADFAIESKFCEAM